MKPPVACHYCLEVYISRCFCKCLRFCVWKVENYTNDGNLLFMTSLQVSRMSVRASETTPTLLFVQQLTKANLNHNVKAWHNKPFVRGIGW